MNDNRPVDRVPIAGPLSLNSVYRRAQLHNRFGGNRNSGIVPSKREPVVLLFHTEEPTQQFYRDAFDEDGVYWYSGEGTSGDMSWTPANRAIRDHAELGLDLLFFERAQRKDGLWRFVQMFQYFAHKKENRRDKAGKDRTAIIFGLLPVTGTDFASVSGQSADLEGLRQATRASTNPDAVGVRTAIANVYIRSEAVRFYALSRASGRCEACGSDAPFVGVSGAPFLEVHSIDRLADNGPDRIDRVAALCPNCHRRCHYAADRNEYNFLVRKRIVTIEDTLNAGDHGKNALL